MKLGSKIFLGFTVLIAMSLLLGVIGMVSFNATRQSFAKNQALASLRMTMASLRQQEKNFQIRGLQKYGNDKENALEKWENLRSNLAGQIDGDLRSGTLSQRQVDNLKNSAATYIDFFLKFAALSRKNGDILAIWREVGTGFNAEITKLREGAGRGDPVYLMADHLETGFVLMRVAALYYIKDTTVDAWEKFVAAMNETKERGDTMARLTTGSATLQSSGVKVTSHLSLYIQKAKEYRENDLKKAEAEGNMIRSSRDFENTIGDLLEQEQAALDSLTRRSVASISFVCLLSLLIGILVAAYLTRFINVSFHRVMDKLQRTTTQLTHAASELGDTSSALAQASSEQASSLQETAASLEEIGGMIGHNVENAQQAEKLAQQVQQISQKTDADMINLQESMRNITANTERIRDLVKIIANIGEKTQVMDEIVFQTKLLSFNASVEAERAGEHGRGFAVVAQEVGNLAQMSGKAAQEIATIVRGSIREADIITAESKQRVDECLAFLQASAGGLKTIVNSVQTVTQSAGQVVSASRDQSHGIQQINAAMSNLEKVTQTNAGTAESTSSSGEHLREQLTTLHECLDELDYVISGVARSRTAG